MVIGFESRPNDASLSHATRDFHVEGKEEEEEEGEEDEEEGERDKNRVREKAIGMKKGRKLETLNESTKKKKLMGKKEVKLRGEQIIPKRMGKEWKK